MRFTIVTPSYNQLDWLRLCVASVRDQVANSATQETGSAFAAANGFGVKRRMTSERESETRAAMPLTIEHIVQDAGTPGIEDFAREQKATFYRDGELVFGGQPRGVSDDLHGPRGEGYSLTIYSEKDAGMYDAVNRGLRKGTGEICAYLNCDEQYLPGALHWVGRFFAESNKVEVLFGDVITISPDGEALCHRKASLPHPWHVMIAQLPIFTAATFFRSELVKKGFLFPDGWRDLGDAVWIIELRRRGVRCRVGRRFLSTFTYTGENMNLQPNARAERIRLTESAPWVAKVFSVPIIWTHRLIKRFAGAYRHEDLTYEIWCSGSGNRRTRFHCKGLGWTWPGLSDTR